MGASEFGSEVHRLLAMQGMSLRELARQVPIDAGQLCRVLNGQRRPGRDLARRCDEIFETGHLLRAAAAATRSQEEPRDESGRGSQGPWHSSETAAVLSAFARQDLSLDRRKFTRLVASVAMGASLLEPLEQWLTHDQTPRIGRRPSPAQFHDVEHIEHAARLFRSWDNQFGGGLRRKAVVGQLSEVADLVRDGAYAPALTRRLFGAMAQLAETAATMSWDCGQGPLAQRYYLLALRASTESGDREFGANILAGMARQLLYLDRANNALELVRLAQDGCPGHTVPTVRAMLMTRQAWAHAQLGRLGAFRRATSRAEDLLRDADQDEQASPYWIRYFDESELAGVTGGRLLKLAHTRPGLAPEAARYIERAIQLRPAAVLRSSALDHIGLAEARFLQGEAEEAARVGHRATEVAEQTNSHRVAVKLQELQGVLASTPTPAIKELRDRISDLLTAQITRPRGVPPA